MDAPRQTVLQVITHPALLDYLTSQFREEREIFFFPITELSEVVVRVEEKEAREGWVIRRRIAHTVMMTVRLTFSFVSCIARGGIQTHVNLQRIHSASLAFAPDDTTTMRKLMETFEGNASLRSVVVMDTRTKGKADVFSRSDFAYLALMTKPEEYQAVFDVPMRRLYEREFFNLASSSPSPSPSNSDATTTVPSSSSGSATGVTTPVVGGGVKTALMSDTLFQVFVAFAESRRKEIVLLDPASGEVRGAVTLSDLLAYFVATP